MMSDDNDGQMIFRDLGVLELPDICLTGEEKPRKNLTQEACPDRESNPGPLRDRHAVMTCSRAKLKSKGDNASSCFRPQFIAKIFSSHVYWVSVQDTTTGVLCHK